MGGIIPRRRSGRVTISGATVILGDCLEILPTLDPVDAIVTDPPYHLTMHTRAANATANGPLSAAHRRLAVGFMGQRWDGGDIAFRPETWAAMLPVLKAGGFLLAFGGTRTHHRIWCAIEDAGFVIKDTIMWLYGQGFPKGRTQLKPAFEPICVAYKPGGKRSLQVDECRIESENAAKLGWGGVGRADTTNYRFNGRDGEASADRRYYQGRWPANICHDGSDEVMEAFAAFGESKSGAMKREVPGYPGTSVTGMLRGRSGPSNQHGDSGSRARFFYAAKANKTDRAGSKHPTVKPIALMRRLVKLVCPPGGLVLDPFAGSGTTGAAALADGRNAILIEREPEYFADIKRRLQADQRKLAKAA